MSEEDKLKEEGAVEEPQNMEDSQPEVQPEEVAVGESEETPSSPNRDKLRDLMSKHFEGYNPDDEENNYGLLAEYIGKNNEQSSKLAEALSKDPRLAQALADVANGKSGAAAALVRYFGKDFLSAEEGSPEAEELNKAEEDRKKEIENDNLSKKEYDDNVSNSIPIITAFCEQKGYDPDEFLGNVWEGIVAPIFTGMYTPDLLDRLDKAFNYDKDVSDAMTAGEVKGRNTKINKMKESEGDGLPKGLSDEGGKKTAPPKAQSGSILDLAKMA